MGRTLATASVPAALVAAAWLRLAEAPARPWETLLLAALALLPALPRRLWQRLAAVVPAALVAAWVALGPSPFEARPLSGHDFFGPLADRFLRGLRDYYDVELPFDAAARPEMRGLLMLAAFGFCVLVGLAVAARRPAPVLLATAAGVGWAGALVPDGALTLGALALAACLWVLVGLRGPARTLAAPAAACGLALVAAAVALSASDSVARGAVVAWQTWDVYDAPAEPVGVDYVWDSSYDGISFPKEKTVVLRIRATRERQYWRATTLSAFTDDRWIENHVPLDVRPVGGPLAADELTPPRARNAAAWTKQEVEVVGLADEHVVAASMPMAVEGRDLGIGFYLNSGVVFLQRPLRPGLRYTVWSYAPKPRPETLAQAGTRYPEALGPYLDVGRARVDPFGTAGRERLVGSLFTDERYQPLWPYRGVWERARAVTADAGSPYAAALALEAWFRDAGGFRYDEQPPRPAGGAPPLADFVLRAKAGYCQQFAGAMALMLRLLGVPARVAAGFTSGTYERGAWVVTDHDAHAWVEIWFPGYGWLPFDPTPGRGELAGAYTTASQQFNARDTLDALTAAGAVPRGDPGAGLGALLAAKERNLASGGRLESARGHGLSALQILALASFAAAAAIGLAKLARRRARYLTRDPRRIAAAARREVAEFLLDQRVDVSPSATASELGAVLERELGVGARAFADAAGAARFGPPHHAGAAALAARREARALLRLVRARLTLRERLRGFVAVRSLRA